MRLNILSDADWESRVDQVLDYLSESNYRSFFEGRDYGLGLVGVTMILVCHDPALALKRRVRLSKKERKLYFDILLDLPEMKNSDQASRKKMVAEKLLKETSEILKKYNIGNFDQTRFIADFQEWIVGMG